ncbi:MAG TPA: hypothetical protein VKI65_21200, partial [Gemmataceae bacterium]|nr:hypothetical protein [Gemmataceae bacterium]
MFQMTSSAIAVGGKDPRFPYPETENWQKALGAHFIWISALVNATTTRPLPLFHMVWTIHAEDRYNFNPGAKDIATGTPDSENGIFEITGLAKQYMNYATLIRDEWWSGATRDILQLLYNAPGTW